MEHRSRRQVSYSVAKRSNELMRAVVVDQFLKAGCIDGNCQGFKARLIPSFSKLRYRLFVLDFLRLMLHTMVFILSLLMRVVSMSRHILVWTPEGKIQYHNIIALDAMAMHRLFIDIDSTLN